MKIERFFGDAEHTFKLTDPMIQELERLTDLGIGAVYQRVVGMAFHISDLTQIIRLSLIGADMPPQEAKTLTDIYAVNRPIAEVFPLALDILDARWGEASDANDTYAEAAQ